MPWDLLLAPFVDPMSRTFWGSLLVAAGVAAALAGPNRIARAMAVLTHPSSRLDVQLLVGNQLLRVVGLLPTVGGTLGLSVGLWRGLDSLFGVPSLDVPPAVASAVYGIVLFVAWDASRYALHRLMHAVPALWAIHQVHHSAEVLSPLTLHRSHPIESLLFRVRRMLVTGLVAGIFLWLFRPDQLAAPMGALTVVGVALNSLLGNLRHSHIYLRLGPLERVLLSPAQHQLHHADDPEHYDRNFGVWLAVWDRLGGTWVPSPEHAPTRFGVGSVRNHGGGLLSAWWHPMVDAGQALLPVGVRRRVAVAVALIAPGSAAADDPYEIVVTDEAGVPAVAGSATVLDEEDLERFEHDNIHAILAEAPGVYTRSEDGFGLRPNIGIRGANSERSSKVMLLEDGVPLAPAPYAAPAAYYFPMSTRLVGVEVFKGPAATQYGPQTIGGALNLRTRAVPVGLQGGLDLAVGLRNTVKLHAWAGGGTESRGVLVEGSHLATDGFKHLPDGGPTGFDRTDLMVKLRQQLGTHSVQLKLGLGREQSHETYTGMLLSDAQDSPYQRYAATALDRMQWTRTQVELSHTVRPSNRVDVHTTAYHHYLERSWFKLNRFADGPELHSLLTGTGGGRDAVYLAILRGDADSSLPGESLLIGDNDRAYHSMGVQSRVRISQPWGTGRVRAEAGLRVHHDIVDRLHTEDSFRMTDGQLVRDETPRQTNTDTRSLATALSTHAMVQIERGDVELTPSARVEHVITQVVGATSDARTTVLPGLSMRWEATPSLDLFTGVHRGFSPVAPGQSKEVRPESSVNGELGLRATRGTGQVELVGFVSNYDNIVGDCTFSAGCQDDTIGQQFNGGRVVIAGLEAMARDDLVLTPGLTVPIQANYTLTHGTFRSDFVSSFPQYGAVSVGDHLPYVPAHQAHVRAGLSTEHAGIDLGVTARSGLRDAAQDALDPERDVPALTLVDASGRVNLNDTLQLYTTVTNALNSQRTVSRRPYGARPVAPFQVMFGVKAH